MPTGLAFILAVILLLKEYKTLKNKGKNTDKIKMIESNEIQSTDNNIIITIAREYGSGGRYIGKLVAQKLGIKLYDKKFIEEMAENTGFSVEYIKENEQKRTTLDNFNNGYYSGLTNADELFIKEAELIKELANKESCVIVGRCADFILKDKKNVIKIFITNSLENKIKRATTFYKMNKEKAEKEITRINKLRANHYKYYTDTNWKDPSNYDICINSDSIGIDYAVELICNTIRGEKSLVIDQERNDSKNEKRYYSNEFI